MILEENIYKGRFQDFRGLVKRTKGRAERGKIMFKSKICEKKSCEQNDFPSIKRV